MSIDTDAVVLREQIRELERKLQAALNVLSDWQLFIHAIMCAKLNDGDHDEICAALDEELRELKSS